MTYPPLCHPERSGVAEQHRAVEVLHSGVAMQRNGAKPQGATLGTVPCDMSAGHVTAGLSPVSRRSGISKRFLSRRLHQVTLAEQTLSKSIRDPASRYTRSRFCSVPCPAMLRTLHAAKVRLGVFRSSLRNTPSLRMTLGGKFFHTARGRQKRPPAPRYKRISRYLRHATGCGRLPCGGMPPISTSPSNKSPLRTARAP